MASAAFIPKGLKQGLKFCLSPAYYKCRHTARSVQCKESWKKTRKQMAVVKSLPKGLQKCMEKY